MEDQPFQPLGLPPEPPPIDTPSSEGLPPEPPRPREPFWGYGDVALFIGFLIGSLLASIVLFSLFRTGEQWKVVTELAVQSFVYVLAFAGLGVLFRIQYDRPFWRSLGFVPFRMPPVLVVLCGIGTAIGVAVLGVLLHTPNKSNRMTDILEDPNAIIPVAIFGLTLAPLAEELAFRGFLQPLLVRSLGAVPGIMATAVSFGLLHFQEYGNSWRHALLISLVGGALGWMRHRTGSTMASTLMHASYNALEFVAFFAQQKALPHP